MIEHEGLTAGDLVASLQHQRIPLPFEVGAFVALEACEAIQDHLTVLDPQRVLLSSDGSVVVEEAEPTRDHEAAARSIVALLAHLLLAADPGAPKPLMDLIDTGPPGGIWSVPLLAEELKATLVPLNRDAARRVLSRLIREANRNRNMFDNSSSPPPEARTIDAQLDNLLQELPEHAQRGLPEHLEVPVELPGEAQVPNPRLPHDPGPVADAAEQRAAGQLGAMGTHADDLRAANGSSRPNRSRVHEPDDASIDDDEVTAVRERDSISAKPAAPSRYIGARRATRPTLPPPGAKPTPAVSPSAPAPGFRGASPPVSPRVPSRISPSAVPPASRGGLPPVSPSVPPPASPSVPPPASPSVPPPASPSVPPGVMRAGPGPQPPAPGGVGSLSAPPPPASAGSPLRETPDARSAQRTSHDSIPPPRSPLGDAAPKLDEHQVGGGRRAGLGPSVGMEPQAASPPVATPVPLPPPPYATPSVPSRPKPAASPPRPTAAGPTARDERSSFWSGRAGLALVLAGGVAVVWATATVFFGDVEQGPQRSKASPASRKSPAVQPPPARGAEGTVRLGDVVVDSRPRGAQVLLFVGKGPVVDVVLHLGVSEEFVAVAPSRKPARYLLPEDWRPMGKGRAARYELPLQTLPARRRRDAWALGPTLLRKRPPPISETWPTARVHIVTDEAASVYRMMGTTPGVVMKNVPLQSDTRLLVHRRGYRPREITLAPSSFKRTKQGRLAALDVRLKPAR